MTKQEYIEDKENPLYEVRECMEHFHVTCGGMDLIGGKFNERVEAEKAVERLNGGEDIDDVLPYSFQDIFKEFLEATIGPDPLDDGEEYND